MMSSRLRALIPFDCLAVYLKADKNLYAQYIDGECAHCFSKTPIALGEGLSGWVAGTGKPILNGNPAVEPGYAKAEGAPSLASALALPLVSAGHVVGVVALYRRERDAFAADELVVLLELCPALASLILDGDQPKAKGPANNLLEMASAVRNDASKLVGA